jgi:glutaconate CoA-transferase subunit A
MAQFLTLAEAIEASVRDGDTVAMEGFTHLIPHAAGHEVIRQKRRRLTLVRMTPDLIYDQLIGMGCAKKLVFSWGGNPGVGSLHRLRDAVEHDWPRPLEIEEHSHAAMANAYEAAAAGLPCAIFRGYRGAELARVNPNIKFIACPFTGEKLACVPAHQLDCSIIHAQKANRQGDVLIEGIVGVQKEAVLAAARSVVTVEEIVDDFGRVSPNACILPSWTVGTIAMVPGGAHPSYAHGYYPRDNAFYKAWDRIARNRDCFLAWMDDHVLRSGPEAFARHAAKAA